MSEREGESAASAELLSEIAHDLRNLLEGLDQMVLSRPEIGVEPEIREVVHRELLALVLKTERHSDALGADVSARVPERRRMELRPLCDAVTRNLWPFLGRRSVSVEVPGELEVKAERVGLRRSLTAALYAVCRSTAETSPVRVVASADGGGHLLSLAVESDLGLDRAEGPLRLEELDIYDRVLRRQGGKIVYERRGSGLRVTLSIPRSQSETERELASEGRGPGNGPAGSPTPSSVLVVDDNEDAARSLAVLLELEGYRTEVRFDGRSALEAARSELPAVVLLDLGLPDVDGFEVCRELRDSESLAGLKIVAVSGFGDEDARRRVEEAGFDDHLLKPVDPGDLRRVLGARGPREGPAGAARSRSR